MRRAQNTVKRGGFWRAKVSAAGGAAPLSYGEERNAYGKDTARGPLAGFKRLRATAGQGPNYVGPSCGYMLAYVGLCWSILRAMWAHLVAMLAYVGLRLIHCCPRLRLARSSFVLWGLELVAWDGAVGVCAFGVGVGVFGCGVGRLHFGVWSWWVGIGRSSFVLSGLRFVLSSW